MQLDTRLRHRRARIELLPMIDVVFLLLVFFIYAMLSMVVHRGLPVDLPTAGAATTSDQHHLAITLDAEGRIYLDRDPTPLADLADRIHHRRATEPDLPVSIGGDQRADLGTALSILDHLRRAGIHEVTFRTRPQP